MISILLNTDPTPWFDVRMGNLVGGFAGAGLGILGGTFGAAVGIMAPKGQGRGVILGSMLIAGILGGIVLVIGIVAISTGQPYHVHSPMMLIGSLLVILFGVGRPVIRKRYMEAEARRLEADALRRS